MDKVQEKTSRKKILNNLILHLHPKVIPESTLRFTLTFGLGGMTALLIVLQALTGLLLRFVYVPTPAGAYNSVLHIKNELVIGSFVRNIHYWSGSLLIVIVFLHMLRVFFTSAFHERRKSNWVFGVILLILVLLSNFTGYLLPWDQLAYWAITVVSNMLNYIPVIGESINSLVLQGTEVGAPTLILFYNLHTGLVPLALIILMAFHFWKVRKAGGVIIPGGGERKGQKTVSVMPHLLAREFVVALVLLAVVFLLAVILEAPLQERANPLSSPNPAKAPWYFQGFQELILHFHPTIAVVLVPVTALVLMFSLPYLKYGETITGIWFISKTGKKLSLISLFVAITTTPAYIVFDEYVIRTTNSESLFGNGIITFVVLSLLIIGFAYLLRRKFNVSRAEIVQTLFIYLVSSFIVLTITGIFFRGEGMALTIP